MAENKKRDLSLDIAKGICIILMVVGHAGCPEWINKFMGLIRMPCFFFISGILLSDRYLDDLKSGVRKKLKGYYRPFVKWSLIFLLLHNVFAYLHIYETTYTLQEIGIKIIRIFTMTGGEQLLGGYWFLISLTWASIGTILILSFLKRRNKLTNIYIMGGVMLSLVIASIQCTLPIKVPAQFSEPTFLALAFFMSGYLFRKIGWYKSDILKRLCIPLLVPAIITALLLKDVFDMNHAGGLSALYYIVAVLGTVGFIQIAKMLKHGLLVKAFNYIGDKTLYILTFHFLAFKPISYLWIKLHDMPITNLSQYPVIEPTNSWMWVVYSIAGVIIPLLIWELFHLPILST